MVPFTLNDFIVESNRIEGITGFVRADVDAHRQLLRAPVLTVPVVRAFVQTIARAELRSLPGMDVRVGSHIPPRGGPGIVLSLDHILEAVSDRRLSAWDAHRAYEDLHPFMDGNGRSGRAVWLWQMGGIAQVPLGFLHTFYYQTLDKDR